MAFEIKDRVKITGNLSQGVRHYDMGCLTGYIEYKRGWAFREGKHIQIDAYKVRLDNGYFQIVASEDLSKLEK